MKFRDSLLRLIEDKSLTIKSVMHIDTLKRHDIIRIKLEVNNKPKFIHEYRKISRELEDTNIVRGGMCELFDCIYENGAKCKFKTDYMSCSDSLDRYNEVHFYRYLNESESSLYLMKYLANNGIITK